MKDLQTQPAHIGFDSWLLAKEYNPELLRDQLLWLLEDSERRESAIGHIQPILGFNALVIALSKDENTGRVNESIQLNFYDKSSVDGDDVATLTEAPHAHAKDGTSTWYAPEKATQIITRHGVLPSDEPPIAGTETEQRLVVANCIQGLGNGRRSQYDAVVLGSTAVSTLSRSWVTNAGRTFFSSTEVHSIGTHFQSRDQVGISVHHKSGVEADAYNTHEGLVRYKRLTHDQASKLLMRRGSNTGYAGPITMMYPREENFDPNYFKGYPNNTSTETAERLLQGGLATVLELC